MCWFGKYNPIVAEEDRKVYKICKPGTKGKVHSYYRGKMYEEGKTYTSIMDVEGTIKGHYKNIKVGLHSYSTECPIKFDTSISKNIFIDYFSPNEIIIKVECVIPKGATYCENEKGEIVSDTLRIVSCSTLPNNVYAFVQRKECISPEWRE